jgi:hypothetical protein
VAVVAIVVVVAAVVVVGAAAAVVAAAAVATAAVGAEPKAHAPESQTDAVRERLARHHRTDR